jgi:cellulose synthase/poly-beta-1,6-N-acetylglucosamine synthase-like glycosyltransferase
MTLLLLVLGFIILVPTLVLLTEVILGMLAGEWTHPAPVAGATAAIMIPAHNEESVIAATLESLRAQLAPGDLMLVVADNCSDSTADVARKHGAHVAERHDTTKRGKGFALAYGLETLKSMVADVVIVIDADCIVSPNSIQSLKAEVIRTNRPVQGFSWMRAPKGHEKRFAVAEFAWRVKNRLRPAGLASLGLPCQLMGTGMAFPRDLAEPKNFSSGNIVEDLELGVRMARGGRAPVYFPAAIIASEFPISEEGEISQRRRWEGGSFSMLLKHGVRNVFSGITSGNMNLTALGFDMLVPPLVLHAALIILYSVVTLTMALVFGTGAVWLALLIPALYGAAICIAWWAKGRDLLPLSSMMQLLPFVLAKLRIYGRKDKGWVRTDRTSE